MKVTKIFKIVTITLVFTIIYCVKTPLHNPTVYGLVIHGGAGTITRDRMSKEKEAEYRGKIMEALTAGYRILERGDSSLDAVEAVVRIMEDSPLFNAGKGAVFTNEGRNELDASIMDGSNLQAGAVAGVKTVKNPISAARRVMEKTWHVMLTGDGADHFATEQGLEIVDNNYFYTERRWKALKKAQAVEKHGTVGCVALDKNGNITAGTSTGGLTNKRWGRVGDTPIIGAGTYANNETCGVSGTGQGEYFIRGNIAYDVSALMMYRSLTVKDAAGQVIDKLSERGGTGGLIAMDRKGNIAMSFNTEGMYRGHRINGSESVIKIYGH